jgi:antagonist of KipI
MESRSTYTKAAFGGCKGRRLAKGDQLETGIKTPRQERLLHVLKKAERSVNWFVPKHFFDSTLPNDTIQLIKNDQYESFTEQSKEALFSKPFKVSTQSDRMGYRLDGIELKQAHTQNELSSAVPFGTMQVPPDGKPIILLADRQTTGGYPVIGYIASIDRHKLAQLKPGDKINFRQVDLDEAQQQFYIKEEAMRQLKTGIDLRLKGMIK